MKPQSKQFIGVNLKNVQCGMDYTARRCVYDTKDDDLVSVTATPGAQTWDTGVITIKGSNNPDAPASSWIALSGVSTITASSPALEMFAPGFRYIAPFITTANSVDSFINLDFAGRN